MLHTRALVALLVLASGAVGHAQPATIPLTLAVECAQAPELIFSFALRNVSKQPTAAIIGVVLGNDRTHALGELSLTIRREGVADMVLRYIDPSGGLVAGRLDPWLLALPPGASYAMPIRAKDFRSPQGDLEKFSEPARVRLQLTTHEHWGNLNHDLQGLKFIEVWAGALSTEWLEVPDACHPGR